MKYKEIEFVCGSNNGRSPVAEAVGRKTAQQLGIEGEIIISSSGTIVDTTSLTNLGTMLLPYAEAAARNGLISHERIKQIEDDPRGVLDELIAIEEGWRNRYIADEIGLDYTGHVRRQTVASPGERLILSVDETTLRMTRTIYSSFDYNPTIESLPSFVGSDLELHQIGIGGYDDYKALAQKVDAAAREAVLKSMRS